MSSSHAVPLLVRLLIGVVLALLTWGVGRVHARNAPQPQRDDLLLSLLVFAVFALGVFLTYALFDLGI